jgi:cytoskeletal protein CcmA (bactofilin family)
VLKSHAYVVGDIQHDTLLIEKGAHFEGRSVHSPVTNVQDPPENLTERLRRRAAPNGRERIAPAG